MPIDCPQCQLAFPETGSNIDLASCPKCGNLYRLSEVEQLVDTSGDAGAIPPKGMWCRSEGDRWEVGMNCFTPFFCILLAFMVVWMSALIYGLFFTSKEPLTFNLGGILCVGILLLFGPAFTALIIVFGFGKCYIRVIGDDACIFHGIGKVGIRQKFKWSQVRHVYDGGPRRVVQLEMHTQAERHGFGEFTKVKWHSNYERRAYLVRALRCRLIHPAPKNKK